MATITCEPGPQYLIDCPLEVLIMPGLHIQLARDKLVLTLTSQPVVV